MVLLHLHLSALSSRRSNGGRDGRLGGIFGVSGRVRGVAVGVRLALQGEDAAQPADGGGGEVQGQEEAALPGEDARGDAHLRRVFVGELRPCRVYLEA